MTILLEANELIHGEKHRQYGDAKENLQRVAEKWDSYITQKYGFDGVLDAEDVCWMMVLLKMCRQMHLPQRDNLTDAAGYIGLVEKVTPEPPAPPSFGNCNNPGCVICGGADVRS